ncbi:MAG: Nuclear envelope morphology protein 1 [Thelocarpon superellum]|nr:MAG: Nuclear envelope morphology protein 1 [Thelocarpon superellum]
MNALNILSARVIGPAQPQTPTQPPSPLHERRADLSARADTTAEEDSLSKDADEAGAPSSTRVPGAGAEQGENDDPGRGENGTLYRTVDEKSPLLTRSYDADRQTTKPSAWGRIPRWLANALLQSLRWVFATLAAPGVYLVASLYDDRGNFNASRPFSRRGRSSTAQAVGLSAATGHPATSRYTGVADKGTSRRQSPASSAVASDIDGSSAIVSSDSELDQSLVLRERTDDDESPARHTRSKSSASSSSEDLPPSRRSIRIKLYNQEPPKRRKARNTASSKSSSRDGRDPPDTDGLPTATPATLKSPTSPSSSLRMTKYPRAPNPPRPLIPRRTPSYTFPVIASSGVAQKTLILDLDETLIHSMAKGGRMSTGHMVEVKLNAPVGFSGGVANAPRHPILYYVHKRPYCDDFLRKVCQWYNLVAFTASVQEYADPVIDWLEQDRKYFSGRYYRQHCTFRGGNYIKDISSVEPDLSKVMIVDNSPSSYVFHEDNAIPIEGWINDPTDNDLLHLIPLLEALQYVTDVRALLALRGGEPST